MRQPKGQCFDSLYCDRHDDINHTCRNTAAVVRESSNASYFRFVSYNCVLILPQLGSISFNAHSALVVLAVHFTFCYPSPHRHSGVWKPVKLRPCLNMNELVLSLQITAPDIIFDLLDLSY